MNPGAGAVRLRSSPSELTRGNVGACYYHRMDTHRQRILASVLLSAVLSLSCLGAGGCRMSSKIVEVIHNQEAAEIDYDSPLKLYKPVENSKSKDDNTAAQSSNKDAKADEREQEMPKNHDEQAQDEQSAPHVDPGDEQSDSPAGNNDGKGKKKPAGSKDADRDNKGSGRHDGGNERGDDAGDNGDDKPDGTGDDDDSPVNPSERGTVYDASTGKLEDLPQCSTLAASAELSEVVAVIGRTDTLTATAEAFLSNAGVKKLSLAGKAKQVFTGTGLAQGSADMKALKKIRPQGLLLSGDSRAFSQEDLDRLTDAGINVIKMPSMRTASGIRACVNVVGSIVSSARAKADAYLDFYDKTISAAQALHGGGYAKGDDYDSTTKGSVSESPKSIYTLYISNWDADARVTARAWDKVFFKQTGVAYTYRGFNWSPLATFMSAGGVVNNAADYIWGNNMVPVLEYNENTVSYTWRGLDIEAGVNGGSGLAGKKTGNAKVLTNSADGSVMLGDAKFPAVVVKSSSIKKSLEKARSKAAPGLYSLWSDTGNGVIGTRFNGEVVRAYCKKGDGGSAYQVLVNPAGFMGSWADGGMESVLESLWAASSFYGNADYSQLKASVSSYYKEFYGYTLSASELSSILSAKGVS